MDEFCNGMLNGAHNVSCRCHLCNQLETENSEYGEYRRYLEKMVSNQNATERLSDIKYPDNYIDFLKYELAKSGRLR